MKILIFPKLRIQAFVILLICSFHLKAQQTYCEKISYMKMVSSFPRFSAEKAEISEIILSGMHEPVLISRPAKKIDRKRQETHKAKTKARQVREKRVRIAKLLYV